MKKQTDCFGVTVLELNAGAAFDAVMDGMTRSEQVRFLHQLTDAAFDILAHRLQTNSPISGKSVAGRTPALS